jgi:hypothetical protein
LAHAARTGTRLVVVDVAAVRFWDSSGLRELAGFTTEFASAGRACRIVGAPAATRRLISAASLSDRLELDGPVDAVVPSPAGAPGRPAVPRPEVPAWETDPSLPVGLPAGGG